MTSRQKEFLFLLAVFGAGVLFRILYLLSFSRLPVFANPCGPDIAEYWRTSSAFLHGKTLPSEELIHAPLYPAFLAGLRFLSGGSFFLLRLLQSLLTLFSGLFFYGVLRGCFRGEQGLCRFTPCVFLVFFSLYPFLIWSCDFFSENLLLVFLGFSLFLLDRSFGQTGKRAGFLLAASGIASALAVLTHPTSLFWIAGAGVLLLVRPCRKSFRIRFGAACLFGASALLTILPFSVSRSLRAGKPVLIQQNSFFNYYLGNHDGATGTCCIPPGDAWNDIHAEASADPEGADHFFRVRTWRFLKQKPGAWFLLQIRKAALAFHFRELTTWSDLTALGLIPWHRSGFFLFPLLAVPGLAALFFILPCARLREQQMLFLTLFFSFLAVQTVFLTSGRYRIPMVIPLMSFSAWFLLSLPDRIRAKRFLPSAGALLCAAVLVFLPLSASDAKAERQAASLLHAEAFLLAGETDKAESVLRQMDARGERSSVMLNTLGKIELDSGRAAEAGQTFRKAEALFPGHGLTLLNLGCAEERQGRFAEAMIHYLAAREKLTGPAASDVCFNIGNLHLAAGESAACPTHPFWVANHYPAQADEETLPWADWAWAD